MAVVTLWDGSLEHECALPLWCAKAARLASHLKQKIVTTWAVSVVIMAPHQSTECPNATYVWHKETLQASKQYAANQGSGGAGAHATSWRLLHHAVMLKWQLFALTQYDLLLYADVDVDVSPKSSFLERLRPPSPSSIQEFNAALHSFLQSPFLIVGSPDHESPINTGVLLIKPRRWVFTEALQLMRRGNWSTQTGFAGAGTPRQLFTNRLSLLRQLELGYLPKLLRSRNGGKAWATLVTTQMMISNSWSFVGGNLDQGSFWYLLYHVHGVGTWARGSNLLSVDHFWGQSKPWSRGGPAAPVYLKRLNLPEVPTTRCERILVTRIEVRHGSRQYSFLCAPIAQPRIVTLPPCADHHLTKCS